MKISVSPTFQEKWANLALGIVKAEVIVKESSTNLIEKLEALVYQKASELVVSDISKLPPIQQGRKAYKACGKDPARYRLSSESLLRRIVKSKGLYFVNNVVEVNNYVSIAYGYPICAFDLAKVSGEVIFTVGTSEDAYEGIGRGPLNIAGMPVFADVLGKFGSATSDSVRTQVTSETRQLGMVIVAFNGHTQALDEALDALQMMLKDFADAQEVFAEVVTYS